MPALDYVTLVEYNIWADRRLLNAAEQIPDHLLRTGTLSKGNAFVTLKHILEAQRSYRLSCQNQPVQDSEQLFESFKDVPALRPFWQEEGERLLTYVRSLTESDLEREIVPYWTSQTVKMRHILVHIVNHSTDHRTELGWFFTSLGYSPGELDYIFFAMGMFK